MNNNITKAKVKSMIIHDPKNGQYKYKREMFTNEELFELEMKHIWEGNWVYLAHESQIKEVNDYFTTYIGRQPIVITKNKAGDLTCLLNSCSHRGAMICRYKKGNKATFTCPFHGWTFNNSGKLLKVKDPTDAGYPEQFNCEGSHDLQKIARFESYKGFLFGSLSADVLPLVEHLGETTKMIDIITDQAPEGLEVVRGSSTYTYEGNWKLQAENGADGYHVSAVHWNYVATTSRRATGESKSDVKAMDASKWAKQAGGFYAYENGHIMLWTAWADPTNRPMYHKLAEWTEKFGEAKTKWMIGNLRNLCLYPNVFLMDQFSTQIRQWRPISVNKTEVTAYCFAPIGESTEKRAYRLRQYEDFLNASGMATPDDLEEFRATQSGYDARNMEWNDICRGATHWIKGADENAASIGMKPLLSGAKTEDEGLFMEQHTYWMETMLKAMDKEKAAKPTAKKAMVA
jgi:benzoate/toluate 1,2-dioxygenase subunit alpha